jgi:hypothetical protein
MLSQLKTFSELGKKWSWCSSTSARRYFRSSHKTYVGMLIWLKLETRTFAIQVRSNGASVDILILMSWGDERKTM